jgi:hypothetical protein
LKPTVAALILVKGATRRKHAMIEAKMPDLSGCSFMMHSP